MLLCSLASALSRLLPEAEEKTSPVAVGKIKGKGEGRSEKSENGNKLNSAQTELTSGQPNPAETL